MQDATLARTASDLRRVGERVEKYADTVKRSGHLAVSIDQLEVQAGRLLVEAIDKGAFPESHAERNHGWWDRTKGRLPGGPFTVFKEVSHQRDDPLPGDTPEYGTAAAAEFDAEQCAKCWVFATKWLTEAFPSRFRDRAAGWDWARVSRDKDGQLVGKDGRTLRGYWYKDGKRIEECTLAEACRRIWSGKLPKGKYNWSLDGRIAHKHDFYDDATWMEHHRIRAEVQADACRLLAELIGANAPTYGDILKSLAPQMPDGVPGKPEPVEPTPEVLLAKADDLSALDGISADDRKKPGWYASLRLVTEWALAYGRWVEDNRPELLSDASTLCALLRRAPDGRAGHFARRRCASLAGDLELIANRWDVSQPANDPASVKIVETASPGEKTKQPLSEHEGWVLEVIRSVSPEKGITGPAIIAKIRMQHSVVIEQGTLTGHIIPKLKKDHGVQNRRRVGYYIV